MKTKRDRELPFKMKDKKVLDRKIEGPNVLIMGIPEENEYKIKPKDLDTDFDERLAHDISDKQFIIEGWIADKRFYTSDILYYDEEDIRDEPWNERYKYLLNKFDWSYSVRLSKPIVVSDGSDFDKKEEIKDAAAIYRQLPDTEGMMVRDYDSTYKDERKFVPKEELEWEDQ